MKFIIIENVEAGDVAARVHPAFRPMLPPLDQERHYTLIVLGAPDEVVISRAVYKALDRMGGELGDQVLALSGTFTQESRQAIRDAGAVVVEVRDFFWTDASYMAVR